MSQVQSSLSINLSFIWAFYIENRLKIALQMMCGRFFEVVDECHLLFAIVCARHAGLDAVTFLRGKTKPLMKVVFLIFSFFHQFLRS
jgi:hypothetical protein